LVLLQFGAGGKIDVVHFGVFVADGNNKTANEFGINSGFDVNVTGANNSGNGFSDLFLLGFAQSGSGGDGDWGETGFGLHDSAVDGGDFSNFSESMVFGQKIQKVDNQWAQVEFGGDIVDNTHFGVFLDESGGQKSGDFVGLDSLSEVGEIGGDSILGVLFAGGSVDGLGVVTGDSKAWDNWEGTGNRAGGKGSDDSGSHV